MLLLTSSSSAAGDCRQIMSLSFWEQACSYYILIRCAIKRSASVDFALREIWRWDVRSYLVSACLPQLVVSHSQIYKTECNFAYTVAEWETLRVICCIE